MLIISDILKINYRGSNEMISNEAQGWQRLNSPPARAGRLSVRGVGSERGCLRGPPVRPLREGSLLLLASFHPHVATDQLPMAGRAAACLRVRLVSPSAPEQRGQGTGGASTCPRRQRRRGRGCGTWDAETKGDCERGPRASQRLRRGGPALTLAPRRAPPGPADGSS